MNETPDDSGHYLDPGDGEGDGELGPGRHQAWPGRGLAGQSRGEVRELGQHLGRRYRVGLDTVGFTRL